VGPDERHCPKSRPSPWGRPPDGFFDPKSGCDRRIALDGRGGMRRAGRTPPAAGEACDRISRKTPWLDEESGGQKKKRSHGLDRKPRESENRLGVAETLRGPAGKGVTRTRGKATGWNTRKEKRASSRRRHKKGTVCGRARDGVCEKASTRPRLVKKGLQKQSQKGKRERLS